MPETNYLPPSHLPGHVKWSDDPVERLCQALDQCVTTLKECTGKSADDELIMKLAARCGEAALKGARNAKS